MLPTCQWKFNLTCPQILLILGKVMGFTSKPPFLLQELSCPQVIPWVSSPFILPTQTPINDPNAMNLVVSGRERYIVKPTLSMGDGSKKMSLTRWQAITIHKCPNSKNICRFLLTFILCHFMMRIRVCQVTLH